MVASTSFARLVLLAIVSAGASSTAFAQQPASPQSAFKPFDLFRPSEPAPSARLQLPQHLFVKPAAPAMAPPTVVCGMTLVPGDPRIDKGIQHDAPKSPRFPIQAVEPQTCRR